MKRAEKGAGRERKRTSEREGRGEEELDYACHPPLPPAPPAAAGQRDSMPQ